jgi:hypothetical protein
MRPRTPDIKPSVQAKVYEAQVALRNIDTALAGWRAVLSSPQPPSPPDHLTRESIAARMWLLEWQREQHEQLLITLMPLLKGAAPPFGWRN